MIESKGAQSANMLLTSRQAALLLAVHESTVKRWCNEGEIVCQVTGGGHRRIAMSDLVAFAEHAGLPMALLPLHPFEGAAWTAGDAARGGDFRPLCDLAFAMLMSDRANLVEPLLCTAYEVFALELPALIDGVVAPLLERIGRAWAAGDLGIGSEHYSTRVLVDALGSLRALVLKHRDAKGSAGTRPRALVGCAEGDLHEVGALAVRLLLEAQGWRVDYLSQDVPVTEFAVMQRKLHSQLVCISFVPPRAPADVHHTIRYLAQLYDADRPYGLVIGGGAVPADFVPPPGPWPFAALETFSSMTDFAAWIKTWQPPQHLGGNV